MPAPTLPARLDPESLDALAADLTGSLVRPDDPAYDEARQVLNAVVDRRPAAIVRAADADDVARAIAFAREHGLELAVRGGGHSIAGEGTVDGGLVIDLAALSGIDIDVAAGVGHAGGGARVGAFIDAAYEQGFTTPFGDAASVGIGGISLGGGIGYLVRSRGLTVDHLVEVELVTADGDRIVVNATEHPDLFWALRGGGGNFGVATRFTFRLTPIGTILGGAVLFPLTREVLRDLIDAVRYGPEALNAILAVMRVPPLPFVAPELHFTPAVAALVVWDGDPADGEAAVGRLRTVAPPLADAIGPMPYPAIFAFSEDGAIRMPFAVRSLLADDLDDAALDEIVARGESAPSPMVMTQIRVLGGAAARVPDDETAYAHRQRNLLVAILTAYEDPADRDRMEAWTADFHAALGGDAAPKYVNFVGDEGEAGLRAAYPPATLERLAEVKRRYDPDNAFRHNHNVAP